jgi:ferrochelatase
MKIGILLSNIGTPDAPTTAAVRRYLKEFLSDPRVVEFPSWLWQIVLRGLILPTRGKRSAQLYQKIWTPTGSPLLHYSTAIADKLQSQLSADTYVSIGMRYGNPSIQTALESLHAQHIERLLILPLYPQYSATTTASTIDVVADTIKKWRMIPEIRTINHYADHPRYIQAICESIQRHWDAHGKKHLLFSFHGLPQRYVDAGDPYARQCQVTAETVATQLKLDKEAWSLAFQSRIGATKWLSPYTDQVLASLPKRGIQDVQVVCPGFAVDCLETLEEIAMRGEEQFIHAGGKSFEYIAALNDSQMHIDMLLKIINEQTLGWV